MRSLQQLTLFSSVIVIERQQLNPRLRIDTTSHWFIFENVYCDSYYIEMLVKVHPELPSATVLLMGILTNLMHMGRLNL